MRRGRSHLARPLCFLYESVPPGKLSKGANTQKGHDLILFKLFSSAHEPSSRLPRFFLETRLNARINASWASTKPKTVFVRRLI